MTNMDHNEAVRLQAAEKYLLGELPKEQHAAFEEHYFDCSACAEEMKASAAFMESSRQVVREEAPQTIDEKRLVRVSPARGGWFGWLRPAFAVPAFAALLLFIGYQNGVTIPQLRVGSSSQSAEIISSSFHLAGSVRGGDETGTKLQVRPGESFLLNFDFTPARTFSEYSWQLLDQAGKAVKHGTIGGDKKYQSVSLPVIGGVESAGKYNLVFFGAVDGNGQTTNEKDVQRLTFTVEFLN
jgi:Putative zinc-finger